MLRSHSAILFILVLLCFVPFCVESKTVGYGEHVLKDDSITKMGKARRMAKTNKDIREDYGGDCEVTIDEKTGDITLNYNKVKKEGCFVDLLI
uniref:Uncharacterized protein n=2 Tax=Meloidogyne TaxID=189290 RepID=A0A6V7TL35_MELEN|nr:unnamed protein product [Meloidogyne enterolobii]